MVTGEWQRQSTSLILSARCSVLKSIYSCFFGDLLYFSSAPGLTLRNLYEIILKKNKILEFEFNLVRMKESEFRNQGLEIRTKGQDQGSRIGQGLGSLCTFVECQETLFPHAGILACLACRPHCVRRPVGERAFLMRSSIILLN